MISREKNEKGKEEKARHQRVTQMAPISQRATEMPAGKRKGKQFMSNEVKSVTAFH